MFLLFLEGGIFRFQQFLFSGAYNLLRFPSNTATPLVWRYNSILKTYPEDSRFSLEDWGYTRCNDASMFVRVLFGCIGTEVTWWVGDMFLIDLNFWSCYLLCSTGTVTWSWFTFTYHESGTSPCWRHICFWTWTHDCWRNTCFCWWDCKPQSYQLANGGWKKKTCYSCWDHSFCGALSLVFLGS